MRFNLYEDKAECKLEDIFEMPEETLPEVPQAWLDNVEVKASFGPINKPLGSTNYGRPSLWDEYGGMGDGKYAWERDEEKEDKHGMAPLSLMDLIKKANEKIDLDIETGEIFGAEGVELSEQGISDGHLDEYDYNVISFGEDAASAAALIEDTMGDMEGHDELLLNVIREAYQLLGDNGKTELAHNGF